MMTLGKLLQIWRYPVKSMGGESLPCATISKNGLAGDRCWAVIDNQNSEIRNAKRWPELLNYHANLQTNEYLATSGFDDQVPDVDIHCPDGLILAARDSDFDARFSDILGKKARLAPLAPPERRSHYQLNKARTEASIAQDMQLLEGEALPDFSNNPEAIMLALAECVTPPGTYVDAYPLHLLTTNSLYWLHQYGKVDAVKERYRPNLLIKTTG
jgi:uncharacterized protein YcbX